MPVFAVFLRVSVTKQDTARLSQVCSQDTSADTVYILTENVYASSVFVLVTGNDQNINGSFWSSANSITTPLHHKYAGFSI